MHNINNNTYIIEHRNKRINEKKEGIIFEDEAKTLQGFFKLIIAANKWSKNATASTHHAMVD